MWPSLLIALGAFAQDTDLPPAEGAGDEAPPTAARLLADPWEAYAAGDYGAALQAFVDRLVERPDDPGALLNLGAAQYKLQSWEEAASSFSGAAVKGDDATRAEALYNLGNVAYRQGKLEEAIQRYQAALELNPDDEDAKYNVEFVRDEIRRRHEEAQDREEQQEQEQEQEQQEGEQDGEQDPQDGEGEPQPQDSPPEAGDDSDNDGLPDDTEAQGDNPTDPQDPDSDDDGLADGEEDANANGRVDEGETDPNNPDTDGDGVGDAAEEAQDEAPPSEGGQPQPDEAPMTPEEAARLLEMLQEQRPEQEDGEKRRGRPVSAGAQDW